jgi:hypothetical protein
MPLLYPESGIEYYFKTCKKSDPEAKAVTVDQSPVAALAKASEVTACHETISRFTRFRRKSSRGCGVNFLFRWFD